MIVLIIIIAMMVVLMMRRKMTMINEYRVGHIITLIRSARTSCTRWTSPPAIKSGLLVYRHICLWIIRRLIKPNRTKHPP